MLLLIQHQDDTDEHPTRLIRMLETPIEELREEIKRDGNTPLYAARRRTMSGINLSDDNARIKVEVITGVVAKAFAHAEHLLKLSKMSPAERFVFVFGRQIVGSRKDYDARVSNQRVAVCGPGEMEVRFAANVTDKGGTETLFGDHVYFEDSFMENPDALVEQFESDFGLVRSEAIRRLKNALLLPADYEDEDARFDGEM